MSCMKSTVLLTITLFLVSAPSPDSNTISEMSRGFLSNTTIEPLLAADSSPAKPPLVSHPGKKYDLEKDRDSKVPKTD